ncbi:hypothetical protein [Ruania zhangjianzhongii]|uniref:hypothetical protein n=1 Tax=Ruania zhangjianzhongii TaxID=2603206 RepID=UPI0011C9D602|nr:hypothetical protein [Ruania zhangjianzhongii]
MFEDVNAFTGQRAEAAQHWAAAHGWAFAPENPALVGRWQGDPFDEGHLRRATEVVNGTWSGRPAVSFQYSYWDTFGERQSALDKYGTHQHVVVMQLPQPLPWLWLAPEDEGAEFLRSLADLDGVGERRFDRVIKPGYPQFEKAWWVRGPDNQFPTDFLHQAMMDRLLQPDARRAIFLGVESADLYAVFQRRPELEQIEPTLRLLEDLIDLVPDQVWARA